MYIQNHHQHRHHQHQKITCIVLFHAHLSLLSHTDALNRAPGFPHQFFWFLCVCPFFQKSPSILSRFPLFSVLFSVSPNDFCVPLISSLWPSTGQATSLCAPYCNKCRTMFNCSLQVAQAKSFMNLLMLIW